MRRTNLILIPTVLALLFYAFAFAEDPIGADSDPVNSALKEEAMRQAFQDAAIKDLTDQVEAESFSSKLFSRLHPYLGFNLIYSDNVYEINSNVQSDLYAEINPGIKLILGGKQDSFYYKDFKQNLILDLGVDINHSFYRSAALNFEAPYAGLLYKLETEHNLISFNQRFRSDYELTSDISFGSTGITHYQLNVTNLVLEHIFHTLGFGAGYDRNSKNFYGIYKQSNSYVDNMGWLTGFWAITPKTRIFMEYDFGFYDYPRAVNTNKDFNYYQAWLGARGELTKKITGLIKFGAESRRYETHPRSSVERIAIEADLKYQQSPKNQYLLTLYRGLLDSDYVSQGLEDGYGFSLGFVHKFNNKLSLDLKGGYQESEYETGLTNEVTRASAGLNYAFKKWMKIELRYDYTGRDSNNANNTYPGFVSNQYSLLTRMEF